MFSAGSRVHCPSAGPSMSSRRRSLVSLSRTLEECLDLLVVVVVVVLTDLLVFRPGVGVSLVQALLGFGFVMFVPGYALVSALFPEADLSTPVDERGGTAVGRVSEFVTPRSVGRISGFERVALSFALSLAFVPLVVVVLTLLPIELVRIRVFLTISALTVVCAGVAAVRRWSLPGDRRFRVPYRAWAVTGKESVLGTESRFEGLVNVALALAILLAVGTFTFAVVSPPDGEQFTDFYVLTETDDGELVAADYPEVLSSDRPGTVHVGIENHEERSVEYTVVVQLQRFGEPGNESDVAGSAEIGRFSTTVGDDEASMREQTLSVAEDSAGHRLRLLFLLYVGDVPETPTRENAYRDLHLWVEGADSSPEVVETEPS